MGQGTQPPSASVSPSVNDGSHTKQLINLAVGLNEVTCSSGSAQCLVHSGVQAFILQWQWGALDGFELRDSVLGHLSEESSSPTTFQ